MAKHRPYICRVCGANADDDGPMSLTGRCLKCSTDAMLTANEELRERRGPTYERWLIGRVVAMPRELAKLKLNDARSESQ